MKKTLLSILCLFTLINLTSAQWGKGKSVKGNGDVQKENRSVSGFNAVTASSGIDVYLHEGSTEKLVIEADGNIIPLIETKVEGKRLKIYSDNWFSQVKKLRVDVWYTNLNGVAASGGSDVYNEGTLSASNLKLQSSGGSDLELNIKVDDLECMVSGGSDAVLSGSAGSTVMQASGGSDIKAYDLTSSKCKARVSGGSDAYIQVADELDVRASGGSDVHYKGNARITSKQVSGSSDIHH